MKMLPVALNLRERRCLVVGGGPVAARKVRSLLECEAKVTVIAPQLCAEFSSLRTHIEYSARPFHDGDCAGYSLVFACTNSSEINAAVAAEAHKLNAWCNRADAPDESDFHSAAVVRRGDICIGLTTGGGSPALTKHLRAQIEACIGPEYSELLELLQSRRAALKETVNDQFDRADYWRAVLNSGVLNLLREGRRDDAERRLDEIAEELQNGH